MSVPAHRRRRTWLVMLFGVVLVSCGGASALLQLAGTVDLYFESGDFGWDALEVAYVVGKVLGSGMA